MIGVARARGPNGKVGAGGGTSTILSDVEYSMTTCLQTSIAVEDGCGSFRSVTIPVATHLEIVHCTCTHVIKNDGHEDFLCIIGTTFVDNACSGTDIDDVGHTDKLQGDAVVVGIDIEREFAPYLKEHIAHGGTLAMAEGVVEEFGRGQIVA